MSKSQISDIMKEEKLRRKNKTRYFTNIHRTLDQVGECEEKQKFEEYVDRLNNVLLSTNRNISILTTFYDLALEKSSEDENHFLSSLQTIFIHNTWGMTILQLSTLVEQKSKDDSISLPFLLDYCSKNKDRIFTRTYQEAKIEDGVEQKLEDVDWKKISTKPVQEAIDHCYYLVEQVKSNTESLRKIRNKIYAHNTKEYSSHENRRALLEELSLDDIKSIQKVAIDVINELAQLYARQKYSYFNANIPEETREFFSAEENRRV